MGPPHGNAQHGHAARVPNGNEIRLAQPGTSQVGLTYQGSNYSFGYTAPQSVWTQLTFRNDGSSTTLCVNGVAQQTLPVSMPLPLAAFGPAPHSSTPTSTTSPSTTTP